MFQGLCQSICLSFNLSIVAAGCISQNVKPVRILVLEVHGMRTCYGIGMVIQHDSYALMYQGTSKDEQRCV